MGFTKHNWGGPMRTIEPGVAGGSQASHVACAAWAARELVGGFYGAGKSLKLVVGLEHEFHFSQ